MTYRKKWSIDHAHSNIAFKIKHLMIAHVKGAFKRFNATIYTTGNDFTTAEIDLWIDASSITTGDAKRDEHLKAADFFDVQNHKAIIFTSGSIEKPDADGNYELSGKLTMKCIPKTVKLKVQFGGILNDPWGNERAGFTVTGKINRTDWGLNWNSPIGSGGLMVSEELNISCELQITTSVKKELSLELENAFNKKRMA